MSRTEILLPVPLFPSTLPGKRVEEEEGWKDSPKINIGDKGQQGQNK
jgi:hypothetical protein